MTACPTSFFFFKQKTAYEMRISDCSSDVCSSDLFAEEPESQVFALLENGKLPAMTFRREEDVVGWGRHILGGAFSSGHAVVESIVTVPGNSGAGQTHDSTERDEVWMIVKRTIDSNTVRDRKSTRLNSSH